MDGNILSREYPTKLEDHGNSRGGGGLKQKCPQLGGEGWYGYFLELHMIIYCFTSWPLIFSIYNQSNTSARLIYQHNLFTAKFYCFS